MSAKIFWMLLGFSLLGACSGATSNQNVITAENWSTVPVEWRTKSHWTCMENAGFYTEYNGTKINKNIHNNSIDKYIIDLKKMTVEYDVDGEWPEHAVENIVIADNRPKHPNVNNFPRFSFVTRRFGEIWNSYSLVFSSSFIVRTFAGGNNSWTQYGKCSPS